MKGSRKRGATITGIMGLTRWVAGIVVGLAMAGMVPLPAEAAERVRASTKAWRRTVPREAMPDRVRAVTVDPSMLSEAGRCSPERRSGWSGKGPPNCREEIGCGPDGLPESH